MSFVSYAQNFEDVILWRALKEVKGGFYVDVGANDPVLDSVTLAFYERGWKGLNVEPSPEYFTRLVRARERDINVQAFASDHAGTVRFFEYSGTGLSTGDAEIAAMHQKSGFVAQERSVPSVTLNELLDRHGISEIHFLKVDVEGAEEAVLRGIDLRRFRPWVVVVEMMIPCTTIPSTLEYEAMLFDADYLFCYFDGLNKFYVPKERHEAMAPLLALPPNVYDGFVRAGEAKAIAALESLQQRLGRIKYTMGIVIDFSDRGNATCFQGEGWSEAETWGTWTDGFEATLRIRFSEPPLGAVLMRVRARTLLHPSQPRMLVESRVNGKRLASWTLTSPDPSELRAEIPAEELRQGTCEIAFAIPIPASPRKLGLSSDARQLGIGVESVRFEIFGAGSTAGPAR